MWPHYWASRAETIAQLRRAGASTRHAGGDSFAGNGPGLHQQRAPGSQRCKTTCNRPGICNRRTAHAGDADRPDVAPTVRVRVDHAHSLRCLGGFAQAPRTGGKQSTRSRAFNCRSPVKPCWCAGASVRHRHDCLGACDTGGSSGGSLGCDDETRVTKVAGN